MKLSIYILLFSCISYSQVQKLPKGFSYLKDIDSTIQGELRYCNHNNFIGIPIDGYEDDVLITSTQTAKALKKAQSEFLEKGFSLKIFDAYRPQTAVKIWTFKGKLCRSNYYKYKNRRRTRYGKSF